MLTSTGLAFIPFIVILIRNFVAVTTSMEFNAGAVAYVRRMEIDVVLALTVVVLAAHAGTGAADRAYPVSTRVNRPANNGPGLLEPIDDSDGPDETRS